MRRLNIPWKLLPPTGRAKVTCYIATGWASLDTRAPYASNEGWVGSLPWLRSARWTRITEQQISENCIFVSKNFVGGGFDVGRKKICFGGFKIFSLRSRFLTFYETRRAIRFFISAWTSDNTELETEIIQTFSNLSGQNASLIESHFIGSVQILGCVEKKIFYLL